MQELPTELQLIILSFLNNLQLHSLKRLAKSWSELVTNTLEDRLPQIQQGMAKRIPELSAVDINLFAAAELGLVKQVNEAIAQGANSMARIYFDREQQVFMTPLHLAATSGDLACVKLLVAQGIPYQPEQPQTYYLSPLHYAAAAGK